MIRVACIGLIAVFLAVMLKTVRSEYAVFIGLAACMIVFGCSLSKLQVIFEGLKSIQDLLSVNSAYIQVVLKVVGIAYISEIASNLCKDAGYSGVGSQIEMFGKLSILVMSMPILTTLLTTIQDFIGNV